MLLRSLTMVFVILLAAPVATAGDGRGVVSRITARADVVYIRISPAPEERAACATNHWHYAFSISDVTGRATLSMALAAYSAKTPVTVKSASTCTHYSNMEDVRYLILEE